MELAEAGKKDEGLKILPMAFKAIDTATKKNIIHPNTAARKKSLLSRMLATK
ncbi:MAG: ribosomal protein [Candidatus Peribacteria bacterium]|nr:ribosomal protein [Candidatus Peribacteria bacterium]